MSQRKLHYLSSVHLIHKNLLYLNEGCPAGGWHPGFAVEFVVARNIIYLFAKTFVNDFLIFENKFDKIF